MRSALPLSSTLLISMRRMVVSHNLHARTLWRLPFLSSTVCCRSQCAETALPIAGISSASLGTLAIHTSLRYMQR